MLSDNVPVAFKVPALIVVAPEYVFAPVKVNVPVPALVKVALVPDIAATSELVPVMVIETAALFCKAIVDVSIFAAETVKPPDQQISNSKAIELRPGMSKIIARNKNVIRPKDYKLIRTKLKVSQAIFLFC